MDATYLARLMLFFGLVAAVGFAFAVQERREAEKRREARKTAKLHAHAR